MTFLTGAQPERAASNLPGSLFPGETLSLHGENEKMNWDNLSSCTAGVIYSDHCVMVLPGTCIFCIQTNKNLHKKKSNGFYFCFFRDKFQR